VTGTLEFNFNYAIFDGHQFDVATVPLEKRSYLVKYGFDPILQSHTGC
jgi:hypothetical protein